MCLQGILYAGGVCDIEFFPGEPDYFGRILCVAALQKFSPDLAVGAKDQNFHESSR